MTDFVERTQSTQIYVVFRRTNHRLEKITTFDSTTTAVFGGIVADAMLEPPELLLRALAGGFFGVVFERRRANQQSMDFLQ